MKSRNFTVTSTASEVIAAEPSTRQVYLHVLGNGVVYLGGADVTTTNGLLTEKAAAPQPLTIPPRREPVRRDRGRCHRGAPRPRTGRLMPWHLEDAHPDCEGIAVVKDDDGELKIAALQEYFGYCLMPHARYKKALLCVGESDCGKSTIPYLLRQLLGSENIAAVSVEHMDYNYPQWESQDPGTPYLIIDDGIGTDMIRLWPTPIANDTLQLIVYRRLLAPLVTADMSEELPIATRLHRMLIDGICWKAYEKNDEETESQQKAEKYALLHAKNIDETKRRRGRREYKNHTVVPLPAMR